MITELVGNFHRKTLFITEKVHALFKKQADLTPR